MCKEILSDAPGPVTGSSLAAQFFERTGRKLVVEINHDYPRRFFQNNPNFVVVEDSKDKASFTISLADVGGGKRGSGEHGRTYGYSHRGDGAHGNGRHHNSNNAAGNSANEEEDDEVPEEPLEDNEPLPPPNPLPEGTSWSRVAAGEKVAKPKADLQKQLSPRLDAEDKAAFPPLSAAAAAAAASPSKATPPVSSSSAGLYREDEDVFKPIVSTAEECEQACGMLRDARELAVLFKSAVGQEDGLSLVQVASSEFVFLFDMLSPAAGRFKVWFLFVVARETLDSVSPVRNSVWDRCWRARRFGFWCATREAPSR